MQTNIFDYGMNGEGVGKIDNKITLVPYALNNETVDVSIIKSFNNYSEAELNSIIVESKNRQTPPCPYFYTCGGCDIQHMNYSEQLNFKTTLVKKTIKKIAGIEFNVAKTVASDSVCQYRNKASFNILNKQSGFFKEKSKDIIDVENCLICSNNINKIHKLFRSYIKNNSSITSNIKNLVIRDIENQILVGIVTKKEIDLSTFYIQLNTNFTNIGLYQIVNTRKDSVVLSGKVIHVDGLKEIKINNFGLTYFVDLIGFHQTNENIQNKLYNHVLQYILPNDIVINGFSGQGLLSAILASKAKKVIGIEIVKNSHISAEKLKADNAINNMQNVLGDFNLKVKDYLNTASTLILDPSKKGCGKEVLKNIIGIKNIVYISCNPIALAKDLTVLKDNYIIEEIVPFDMFPNTKNVETFVKLKIK